MNKINDILHDIKTALLDSIKIFDKGFHYTRVLIDKGIVVSVNKSGFEYVGITDVNGNYFYIKVSEDVPAVAAKSSADSTYAAKENYQCSLIAVAKSINELELKDAILNVLLKQSCVVKKSSVDSAAIAKAEFSTLKEEQLKRVLSRLDGFQLVKFDFVIERIFETNNCTYNICST